MFEIALTALISLCCISMLWFTLKTAISPMPSSGRACRTILKASEQASEGAMIDLCSGWGGLLFALARKYPDLPVIDYELSWLPWIYSQAYRVIFRLKNVRIYRKNFLTAQATPGYSAHLLSSPQRHADAAEEALFRWASAKLHADQQHLRPARSPTRRNPPAR